KDNPHAVVYGMGGQVPGTIPCRPGHGVILVKGPAQLAHRKNHQQQEGCGQQEFQYRDALLSFACQSMSVHVSSFLATSCPATFMAVSCRTYPDPCKAG